MKGYEKECLISAEQEWKLMDGPFTLAQVISWQHGLNGSTTTIANNCSPKLLYCKNGHVNLPWIQSKTPTINLLNYLISIRIET